MARLQMDGSGRTPEQQQAYNNALSLAKGFVEQYGGKLSDYFDYGTGKVTKPKVSTPQPKPRQEVSRVTNADGSITVTFDDKTTTLLTGTMGQFKPVEVKPRVETGRTKNPDGTFRVTWSDGSITQENSSSTSEPPPPPSTKTVSGTNTVTRNGRQIVVTTFSDGTTSEVDYGLSSADAANQKNWLEVGKSLLEQYGVGELWGDYSDLITKGGYDSQTAMLAMQSLPSWTNRFSANKDRLAKGLPVLSPAEYLATEAQYKQVMITAGIDKSVYSNNKYLGDLMGADVSPYETKQRLDAARVQLETTDSFVLDQLKTRFGLSTGDIILHMLDPKVASSVISSKVASAQINAEAQRQGFGISIGQADSLQSFGVTQDQARFGFSEVAQMGQLTDALPGDISGSLTKQELIDSQFKTDAKAVDTLKKVRGRRVAEYEAGGEFAASQSGISGLGSATRGT